MQVGDRVRNTKHYDDVCWPKGHEFIIEKISEYGEAMGKTANGKDGGISIKNCELVASISEVGIKHDNGKPKVSLVSKEFIYGTAKALEYGANKYGKNNYKLGMDWSRVIDAEKRHMLDFAAGVDIDDESKLNHLYLAAANLNMLIYYYENKVGKDDR